MNHPQNQIKTKYECLKCEKIFGDNGINLINTTPKDKKGLYYLLCNKCIKKHEGKESN